MPPAPRSARARAALALALLARGAAALRVARSLDTNAPFEFVARFCFVPNPRDDAATAVADASLDALAEHGLARFDVAYPARHEPSLVWVYSWHNWRRLRDRAAGSCDDMLSSHGAIQLTLAAEGRYVTEVTDEWRGGEHWRRARGYYTFLGYETHW